MNNILFSIITVSFNSAKTIEKTIQSLLGQSCKDFEYLIVDGNSSDHTVDIVKKYEPLFEGRLKWISEPDTGIYNAMNKGIRMASGDIIGIVNSDDWLDDNTLQILSDYINLNNLDPKTPFILTGYMNFHYANGDVQILKTSRERMESYCKVYRMGLNHPATFVTSKVYQTVGLFDENLKLYADSDFVNMCYKAEVPVFYIESILSNMSDNGASNNYSKQSLLDRKYILKKHAKSRFEYLGMYVKSCFVHYLRRYIPKYLIKIKRRNAFNK